MEIKNILKVCQRCCWTTDWEPLVCSKAENGGRKGVAGGIVQTFSYWFKYFNIIGTRPLSETERRQEVLEVWWESIKQSLRGQDHLSMEVEKMQGTILDLFGIWSRSKSWKLEWVCAFVFRLQQEQLKSTEVLCEAIVIDNDIEQSGHQRWGSKWSESTVNVRFLNGRFSEINVSSLI